MNYGKIGKLNIEAVRSIVAGCVTKAEIARRLQLSRGGNSYCSIENFCKRNDISLDHIQGNKAKKVSVDDLKVRLKENVKCSRGTVKQHLIDHKMLKEECALCKLPTSWQGKRLVLILDHINGINNDYTLSNLRLLCPNCNSQTSTFSGRNVKRLMGSRVTGNSPLSESGS